MQDGTFFEIRFLLAVYLSGMLCGFVYDFLRARRKLLNLGNIYVNIEDIIYCLFTGIIFLIVTFFLNNAQIRLSGFLGLFVGEFTYFFILRNRMRNFLVFVFGKIFKILLFTLKILLLPIILLNRLLKRPVGIVVWYAGGKIKIAKSKFSTIKNLAKNRCKIANIFIKKGAKKH